MNSLKIPKSSCTIEDCGFAKTRSRGAQDGSRVKKIRLIFDVTSLVKVNGAAIDDLFVGATDMIFSIASNESDAVIIAKKRKPSEVNVTLQDPNTGNEIFKMIGAACGAPTLRISRKAERVEISIVTTGVLNKDELCRVDDYFKSDCFGMIESTNVDIEEIANMKPVKETKKRLKKVSMPAPDEDENLEIAFQ